MTNTGPCALFAVSSLGLGHATRTLVVIREYLRRGYTVTVISAGNALAFLRLELADEQAAELREMPDYPPLERAQDIDYLFIISGYLLEHKDSFIRKLLEQSRDLAGRKVFILGNAQERAAQYEAFRREDLEIHAVASGELRRELFDRARCVVTRAGYTTIMDLVEHGKRAVLIPTPNQTEQEYLAYCLGSRGHFASRTQLEPDLRVAVHECARTQPFEPPWLTARSVRRLTDAIEPFLYKNHVTVSVPAHNEEKEIAATLRALLAQRYPRERMDIIVVENGSSDATAQIARGIANEPGAAGRIRVLHSERGVSRAKNAGLRAVAPHSEWIVFCDADTRLGRHFLHHPNSWLNRHSEDGLAVGTTAVRAHPGRRVYARAWFRLYDWIHRATRSSYSIQIARTPIARGVGFHEQLHFAEDLAFMPECRRYGRFFFLPTDQVSTSTRRFAAHGYLRQGLRWLIEAMMPLRYKLHRAYEVVR